MIAETKLDYVYWVFHNKTYKMNVIGVKKENDKTQIKVKLTAIEKDYSIFIHDWVDEDEYFGSYELAENYLNMFSDEAYLFIIDKLCKYSFWNSIGIEKMIEFYTDYKNNKFPSEYICNFLRKYELAFEKIINVKEN